MIYTEPELILPALKLLREDRAGLSTTKLIKKLTKSLHPTGHDAAIIPGRKDTYFSQKVRNLKSHNTLTQRHLATYEKGHWKITHEGLKYIETAEPILDSLQRQGFRRKDIRQEIEKDYSDIIIEEGALQIRLAKQRRRSQKLKKIVITEFKRNNHNRIFCIACGFDFLATYGKHGRDFIEIHHLSPVNEMEISGSRAELESALEKVVPLCANCHRMIHRSKGKMLSIEGLRRIITQHNDRRA